MLGGDTSFGNQARGKARKHDMKIESRAAFMRRAQIQIDPDETWTVKAVEVQVTSTHDDKDKEIAFAFDVIDLRTNTIVGNIGDQGLGQVWDRITMPIRFGLSTLIHWEERLNFAVRMYYHNPSGGNQGWEGYLHVFGLTSDAQWVELLRQTGEFKLGENGNPRSATFRFDA